MRSAIVLFSFLFLFSTASFGQDVNFSVTADRTSVSLGERVVVTAQITSNKKLSGNFAPQIGKNDEFDVLSQNQDQSQSTSINVINGKMTQSVTISYMFYYTILPKKPGEFTFPALTSVIDGASYSSAPFKINVGKEAAQAASDVKFTISANKRTLYVGEQGLLTVQIAIKPNAQVTQQGFAQSMDRINKSLGANFSVIQLTNQVKGVNQTINGENFAVFKVQFAVFPLKAGGFSIPPQSLEFVTLKRVQSRRDPFDDFFGGGFFNNNVQQVANSTVSNSLSFQVNILPSQPKGFEGAVGNFSLSVNADPKVVPAQEALTLSLVLKGNTRPNSMPDISLPTLSDCEVFAPEKRATMDTTQNGISCVKSFKYLLIPKNEGTLTIPQISWTYFDPASQSYKTLNSSPIAITVTKGKAGQAAQTRYLTQEEIRQVGQDIRYIKTNEKLKSQSDEPYKNPVLLLLFPIPFLTVLFGFLYKVQSVRSGKNTAQVLRKHAYRKTMKSLSALQKVQQTVGGSDFLSHLYAAVESYLTHKFGFIAAGKTIDEVKTELLASGVTSDAVEACAALLSSIDGFRFGMSALDNAARSALLQKAGTLIDEMDAMKKGKKA